MVTYDTDGCFWADIHATHLHTQRLPNFHDFRADVADADNQQFLSHAHSLPVRPSR
jgi:hypothetical protein